jgi:formylmethanofuran dehydrogenase subunit E
MSEDIIKTLLESLTDEQKAKLVQGLLQSNTSEDEVIVNEENVASVAPPRATVNEDFTVNRDMKNRSNAVKFRKNDWVDNGENRDNDVDYEQFEKTRTPRRRTKPKKTSVECHVCGKTFSVNENLIYGEYIRCNQCTGR